MLHKRSHHWPVTSRREFFTRAGSGLAGMALASLLRAEGADPLAPKHPHHPAKAKAIIWLFMEGGPSHGDLFDPKPKRLELAGDPIRAAFPRPTNDMAASKNTLLPSNS